MVWVLHFTKTSDPSLRFGITKKQGPSSLRSVGTTRYTHVASIPCRPERPRRGRRDLALALPLNFTKTSDPSLRFGMTKKQGPSSLRSVGTTRYKGFVHSNTMSSRTARRGGGTWHLLWHLNFTKPSPLAALRNDKETRSLVATLCRDDTL